MTPLRNCFPVEGRLKVSLKPIFQLLGHTRYALVFLDQSAGEDKFVKIPHPLN